MLLCNCQLLAVSTGSLQLLGPGLKALECSNQSIIITVTFVIIAAAGWL